MSYLIKCGASRAILEILEPDRLLLRYLEMDDLERLFALYRDPDVKCHFPEGTK
ncbi:MAG: hypothetical protein ACK2UK_20160 [Candidatus Promineifilaceae bacterium]